MCLILISKPSIIFSSPSDGVYIYGLSLDGVGWDKRGMRLVEPQPKVLFTPLPVVHMFAINEMTKEQKAQRVSYSSTSKVLKVLYQKCVNRPDI